MNGRRRTAAFWLAISLGFAGPSRSQDLVISEFLAVNDSTIRDEDGEFTDWIEVFNAGATTANVGGWYLTDFVDELTKWQFPPVEIGPGGFLLVFASDK
ncbi:MAG: lamin tail domain-containing protein, partial [Planctomycetota bacterium]|nr:lamin tail domain-containing protein [Planctomycetota bacterium]